MENSHKALIPMGDYGKLVTDEELLRGMVSRSPAPFFYSLFHSNDIITILERCWSENIHSIDNSHGITEFNLIWRIFQLLQEHFKCHCLFFNFHISR